MKHLKARATEHMNLIGLAITAIVILAVAIFVDIEELKVHIENAGIFAPLFVIVLKASTVVLAPLSGSPIYPLVGLLFGFWPGVLYVIAGDVLGVTIAFFLSRTFGYPLVRRFIAGKEQSMLAKVVRHLGSNKGLVQMCLTCFALPELIAYASGLSDVKYLKFIAIYLPVLVTVSSIAVLFGTLLDPSNASIFVSIGIPVAGFAIVAAGLLLFLRSLRDKS